MNVIQWKMFEKKINCLQLKNEVNESFINEVIERFHMQLVTDVYT